MLEIDEYKQNISNYPGLTIGRSSQHENQKVEIEEIEKHNAKVQEKIQRLDLPRNGKGEVLDIYGKPVAFSGISKLTPDGAQLPLTQEHVDEILRCANDVLYFAENYCHITTPKGYRVCPMRPYQEDLFNLFNDNKFVIVTLGRQASKSVSMSILILHATMFSEVPLTSGLAANIGALAQENLARIKETYINLPMWLQIGVKTWNKTYIELSGNRRIISSATGDDLFRGFSISGIAWLDETAFVSGLDTIETSLIPSLQQFPNAKLVYTTTPKGKNAFYEKWVKAIKGRSLFKAFTIDYRGVPGRSDPEWEKNMLATMSPEKFAQEYQSSFLGSSDTLIQATILSTLEKHILSIEPVCIDYLYPGIIKYQDYIPGHKYIVASDTSSGMGSANGNGDASAIHVFDVSVFPFNQVLSANLWGVEYYKLPFIIYQILKEYSGKDIGDDLMLLSDLDEMSISDMKKRDSKDFDVSDKHDYDNDYNYEDYKDNEDDIENGPLVIIENNHSSGLNCLDTLVYNYNYENLYYEEGKRVPGIRTTSGNRDLMLVTLKTFIEKGYIQINDLDTLNQLQVFVHNGKRYEAEKGKHDDLVLALAIMLFPFINMKEIRYDKLIRSMEKSESRTKEENNELVELLSLGFFDDGSDEEGEDDDWNIYD